MIPCAFSEEGYTGNVHHMSKNILKIIDILCYVLVHLPSTQEV